MSIRHRWAARARAALVWAIVLFSLGDLFVYGQAFLFTHPRSDLRSHAYPQTQRVAYLQGMLKEGERFLWFDSLLSWQVDQHQPELLTNRPVMHHLAGMRGYDPVNSRRYGLVMNRITRQALSRNPRAFMFVPDQPARAVDWRLLALWNCPVVLSYFPFEDPALEEVRRWEMAPGQTLRAFRLRRVLGPAWLAHPFVVPSGTPLEEMASLLGYPDFDPTTMALVDVDPFAFFETARNEQVSSDILRRDTAEESERLDKAIREKSVKMVKERPGALTFEIATPQDALLVAAQSYYPGWRARVDGRRVRVIAANVAQCAVPIAAGSHRVEMFYRPRQFYQGAAVSIASVALLFLIAVRRRSD